MSGAIPPDIGNDDEDAADKATQQRAVRPRDHGRKQRASELIQSRFGKVRDHRKKSRTSRLIQSRGKVTFLRAHDVGSRYGPPEDQIDVEVVVRLDSVPDRRMGFQLRDDEHRAARQGMLNLLRDAFTHDWTVLIDYSIDLDNDEKNSEAIRIALTKD